MGIMQDAIIVAYDRGYRVNELGILVGISGTPLTIKVKGKQKYPTFSVAGVPGAPNKYGVFGIPVHKFAAYCFYGKQSFQVDCVRHKNGDVHDVSKQNILLGTHSENNLDKSPDVRRSAAMKARAAQGMAAKNRLLSPDQVRYVRSSQEPASIIAKELGVSESCIWKLRKRETYNDIT